MSLRVKIVSFLYVQYRLGCFLMAHIPDNHPQSNPEFPIVEVDSIALEANEGQFASPSKERYRTYH